MNNTNHTRIVTQTWQNDPMHRDGTLEAYCRSVASRALILEGRKLEPNPESIYHYFVEKGIYKPGPTE